MNDINKIIFDESGQSLVEYSLIISLVALAMIISIISFRNSLYGLFGAIRVIILNAL